MDQHSNGSFESKSRNSYVAIICVHLNRNIPKEKQVMPAVDGGGGGKDHRVAVGKERCGAGPRLACPPHSVTSWPCLWAVWEDDSVQPPHQVLKVHLLWKD